MKVTSRFIFNSDYTTRSPPFLRVSPLLSVRSQYLDRQAASSRLYRSSARDPTSNDAGNARLSTLDRSVVRSVRPRLGLIPILLLLTVQPFRLIRDLHSPAFPRVVFTRDR